MVRQSESMCPLFGTKAKEATPIKLCLLYKLQQLVVVFFGLAWITHNEVATESGLWCHGADALNAFKETLLVSPATHATQVSLAHMLQRQIEVRNTSFQHCLNQVIRQITGVQIQQSHPIHHERHFAHKFHNGASPKFFRSVFSVTCKILSNKHNLACFSLFYLGENGCNIATALGSTKRRDCTKTTIAVTAFGNFYVRPRHRRFRSWKIQKVKLWNVACNRDGFAPQLNRYTKSGNLICFGKRICQLLPIALGHTTSDHEAGRFLALIIEGEHGVDALFARIFNKGTCIDHNDICSGRVIGRA